MSEGPDIRITTVVEKESILTIDGQKVSKRTLIHDYRLTPTLRLFISLAIQNIGDEAARNVVVDNPVPIGTVLALGSVEVSQGEVMCSVDHGSSYHPEVEQLGVGRTCTDLRWIIDRVTAGALCTMHFQVIVENI
jgi:uncharacterized repeat protein (TIGR01451 family)